MSKQALSMFAIIWLTPCNLWHNLVTRDAVLSYTYVVSAVFGNTSKGASFEILRNQEGKPGCSLSWPFQVCVWWGENTARRGECPP